MRSKKEIADDVRDAIKRVDDLESECLDNNIIVELELIDTSENAKFRIDFGRGIDFSIKKIRTTELI